MKQAYFISLNQQGLGSLPFLLSKISDSSWKPKLSTHGEFRPLAVSSEVTEEQLRSLVSLITILAIETAAFKGRLTLLENPTLGRVLIHGSLVPAKDGLPGYACAHALWNVPTTYEAHQAIQTWGSDQWAASFADLQGEMPDAFFLPVSAELQDESLKASMAESKLHDLVKFTLGSFLSFPNAKRIVLIAPPEYVATSIYALTRVLPAHLLEHLTFSTTELNPFRLDARIVGSNLASEQSDIPADWIRDDAVVYHSAKGQQSKIPPESPLVEFLLREMTFGQFNRIDELRAVWQRLSIKDVGKLDAIFRIHSSTGEVSKEEMKELLADSGIANWIGQKLSQVKHLLQWSLQDSDFAQEYFPRILGAVRTKPESLTALGEEVQQAGISAVQVGDLTAARSALEVLCPIVAPGKVQTLWNQLYQNTIDPGQLSWEMRSYLLPRLARMKPITPGQKPDEVTARWLKFPEEKLKEVLALGLPQGHQLAVLHEAVKRDHAQLTPIATAVATDMSLVYSALPMLNSDSSGTPSIPSRATEFFASVLQENPRKDWASGLLDQSNSLSVGMLDECLSECIQRTGPDVKELVRTHGNTLLSRLSGKKSLETVASQLLGEYAGESLTDESIRNFIEKVGNSEGISYEVRNRRAACLTVYGFERDPSLKQETLMQVASAFQQVPPLFKPESKEKLLKRAISAFGKENGPFGEELTRFLLDWGPLFGGASSLCRQTLQAMQQDKNFWKQPDRIVGFMSVAMDATPSTTLNEQTEGLEADAFALVEGVYQRGGKKAISELQSRTTEWPRPAKRQWEFLRRAIVPDLSQRYLRDVVFMFLGGAIIATLFAALKFWKYLQ